VRGAGAVDVIARLGNAVEPVEPSGGAHRHRWAVARMREILPSAAPRSAFPPTLRADTHQFELSRRSSDPQEVVAYRVLGSLRVPWPGS